MELRLAEPRTIGPSFGMDVYLWAKLLHVFFVITWMATVYSLPRMLLTLAEAGNEGALRDRVVRSGKRVYVLGHNLFGGAFCFGLVLWLYVGIGGPWLHAKLVLVVLLLVHFTIGGRWLKRYAAGRSLPSARVLWWFNQVPSILLLAILWLVLAKPFQTFE